MLKGVIGVELLVDWTMSLRVVFVRCSLSSSSSLELLLKVHCHARKKFVLSLAGRSRVLAHRPCPKLEMFCKSQIGSTTFLRLQQSSDDQSRHEFFFFFFFFKPAGDPSSVTLVPDLANQVWPFKSALFKTSRPGKRSWLTRKASATERHGNDRLSKKAVHTIR